MAKFSKVVIFSCVLATLLASYQANESGYFCPRGWLQWDKFCYYKHPEPMNWEDAKEECESIYAKLVVPQSLEENIFLSKIGFNDFWVGCNDLEVEGEWKCLEEHSFKRWNAGQPDNGGNYQDCASLNSYFQFLWDDANCENHLNVVCKNLAKHSAGLRCYTLGPDGSLQNYHKL